MGRQRRRRQAGLDDDLLKAPDIDRRRRRRYSRVGRCGSCPRPRDVLSQDAVGAGGSYREAAGHAQPAELQAEGRQRGGGREVDGGGHRSQGVCRHGGGRRGRPHLVEVVGVHVVLQAVEDRGVEEVLGGGAIRGVLRHSLLELGRGRRRHRRRGAGLGGGRGRAGAAPAVLGAEVGLAAGGRGALGGGGARLLEAAGAVVWFGLG